VALTAAQVVPSSLDTLMKRFDRWQRVVAAVAGLRDDEAAPGSPALAPAQPGATQPPPPAAGPDEVEVDRAAVAAVLRSGDVDDAPPLLCGDTWSVRGAVRANQWAGADAARRRWCN
jgi:hypothetical protein